MPVGRIQKMEQKEIENLKDGRRKELDRYLKDAGKGKRKLKKFLYEAGICSVAEMDYPLRQKYQEFLKETLAGYAGSYLLTYDRIKQLWLKEQRKTLAGRQSFQWRFEETIVFLPYHPDFAVAMELDSVRNKDAMVWDFTKTGPYSLKKQIFTCLTAILEKCKGARLRNYKLAALQDLYHFCIENQLADIESFRADQIQGFAKYVSRIHKSRSKKKQVQPILNFCRRELFLQEPDIHWQANVWFLDRLHLPQNKVNPSASFKSLSFIKIKITENQRYAQEYMKYLLCISKDSISTCIVKYSYIRQFLEWLCELDRKVNQCTYEWIAQYLEIIQARRTNVKTYNQTVTNIYHFFQFLKVHHDIETIPFRMEYFVNTEERVHQDRCVDREIYMEILQKLPLLPEHLRCMFLNLWCLGLRAGEVCTLKGNAYSIQGQDAWIQLYQIKMKNYKRVPIPMALYQVMQVYIRSHQIGPGEYLFQSKNGGAYKKATFCNQIVQFCREYNIGNGKYQFRSHDYRHTLATNLYESGVPLQIIRDFMGHNYHEMTQQYVDDMPNRIAAATVDFFANPQNCLVDGLRKEGLHGK